MTERGAGEHDPLRLFGIKEAAEMLGTDHRQVKEWIESGQLPCLRVGITREPRVSVAMLRAWQEGIAAKNAAMSGARRAPKTPRPTPIAQFAKGNRNA